MIEITKEHIEQYNTVTGYTQHDKQIIPGGLIVHYIIQYFDLPPLTSNQCTFKKPVYVEDKMELTSYTQDNLTEYSVIVGREVKITGTIEW